MTTATKQTRTFETEVKQLLHLMVHALYSNKEIFLRELVSNASDAADKLRFEGLKDDSLYEGDTELKINIEYDKEQKTLTIEDNGIGMSYDEVVNNLGTIAKSGTQDFIKALSGDQKKDANLIGQFGVGFYSSFIVAQAVTVETRRANAPKDAGVRWHSEGAGEYDIEAIEKEKRGTKITLHLKEEEQEFLDGFRLRHVISKYSDHIMLPIEMLKESMEAPKEDEEKDDKPQEVEYEVVNRASALWTVPKSAIEDEQYIELYKHIAHDYEEPLTWVHNKVEGKYEYTSLLYIPARAPFDLFQAGKKNGLKLYVQRVFIMDEVDQFLPNYLRFVKGILDSSDLPLNISREILQSNRLIDSMKSALTKRILTTLEELASNDSDKYLNFWKEFGQVLKEGPAEDFVNKEAIAKLFRFATTHSDTQDQVVSLDDYVSRMKEGQDKIYYASAETFNAVKNSPHLEIFRKKGIEVILFYDRIDEWMMSHLSEFDGKTMESVARGSLESLDKVAEPSPEEKVELEAQELTFKDVLEKVKKALDSRVADVRLSKRLTASPSCIVADENQMTSQMERILKSAGQEVSSKPILELNGEHLLVKRLQEESDQSQFDDISLILLEQAVLSEGGQLDDPATFVKKFNELLIKVAN